jgi:Homing endonuclease associated repeat
MPAGGRSGPTPASRRGHRSRAGRSPRRGSGKQRVPRVERAREIARLRDSEGVSFREIARRTGLAASTVQIYYADPDGARQRRRRDAYRGTCRSCGRPTSGAQGPERAPSYCANCARARRRRWSDERVLAAVRDWHAVTGSPPTVADWSPAHAPPAHAGARRYRAEPGRWPSAALVARRFGSFPAAVQRAGLEPPPRGPRPRWTEERIVAAMKGWVNRTGTPPTRTQWSRAGDAHPAASTVYRVLGPWRRALTKAGVRSARGPGKPTRRGRSQRSA